MVSLLKKFFLAASICLYVLASGAASLHLNDNGTWRESTNIYVNDSGTWRHIIQVAINDNGVWRTVYGRAFFNVTIAKRSGADSFGYQYNTYGSIDQDSIWFVDNGRLARIEVVSASNLIGMAICSDSDITGLPFSKMLMYHTASSFVTVFDAPTSPSSNSATCIDVLGYPFGKNFNWSASGPWDNTDVGQTYQVIMVL